MLALVVNVLRFVRFVGQERWWLRTLNSGVFIHLRLTKLLELNS
jgi:hypothetical protein